MELRIWFRCLLLFNKSTTVISLVVTAPQTRVIMMQYFRSAMLTQFMGGVDRLLFVGWIHYLIERIWGTY